MRLNDSPGVSRLAFWNAETKKFLQFEDAPLSKLTSRLFYILRKAFSQNLWRIIRKVGRIPKIRIKNISN